MQSVDPNQSKPAPLALEYRKPDIAKKEAKETQRRIRRNFVYPVLVIVGLYFIGSIISSGLNKAVSHRGMTGSALNLKNIGLACQIYANDHGGRFPGSFQDMILNGNNGLGPEDFVSPCSSDTPASGSTPAQWTANLQKGNHCSFIYLGRGLSDAVMNPTDVAVAVDRPSDHGGQGMNILYADGHVQWQIGSSIATILAAATTRPIFPPTTNPVTMP